MRHMMPRYKGMNLDIKYFLLDFQLRGLINLLDFPALKMLSINLYLNNSLQTQLLPRGRYTFLFSNSQLLYGLI